MGGIGVANNADSDSLRRSAQPSYSMNSDRFTPFFVPEFGWLFLILATGMAVAEMRGDGERSTRNYARENAPFGLLRFLRIGFAASLVVMGIGLLIRSEMVSDVGLALGALTLIPAGLIARRFKSDRTEVR